jgi:AcrR family transcriptional regulator
MSNDKGRLPRDERRAQLLAAALEVFTAAGYHSAAMDEIADRAGVSKPVLYQHFPSKLDLYLAVLDTHIDSLVFAIQRAIQSTPDNAKRVQATIAAYFDFIEAEGEAFRLLFESDMNVEPAVRERLNRMTYDCAAAVSAVISLDTGLPQRGSNASWRRFDWQRTSYCAPLVRKRFEVNSRTGANFGNKHYLERHFWLP